MQRQSNTALYVVFGCVLLVAAIVVIVRTNTPPNEVKKSPSALASMKIDVPNSRTAPSPEDNPQQVDIIPITIEGTQGLLVRYETENIVDSTQKDIARSILNGMKAEVEKAGIEVIVVIAAKPNENTEDADPPKPSETHITGFRFVDGLWIDAEPPGSLREQDMPSAAGSAAPHGSNVPLVIPHGTP